MQVKPKGKDAQKYQDSQGCLQSESRRRKNKNTFYNENFII